MLYRATKYRTIIVVLYLRDPLNPFTIIYLYNSKLENEDGENNLYDNDYKEDNEELEY